MLFSEVYSAYFNTVVAIVSVALSEDMTESRMLQIIQDKAFSESMLTILPAFKNEEWLVLNKALQTPISQTPAMPLTMLQKRWTKSLFSEPRIALFDLDAVGLEDVEPLCAHTDFVFFDRYADGDPYGDPEYVAHFKTILLALRNRQRVTIRYAIGVGKAWWVPSSPLHWSIPPRTTSSAWKPPAASMLLTSTLPESKHASCGNRLSKRMYAPTPQGAYRHIHPLG